MSNDKNVLTVEENTREAGRAIELMILSGLPYEVVRISSEQAEADRKKFLKVPRLDAKLKIHGIIDTLDGIEWYSKYCRGDSSYK